MLTTAPQGRSAGLIPGRVTKVTSDGPWVELAGLPDLDVGPCLDTVGSLEVGDRVVVEPLARDPDDYVIVGRLDGDPAPPDPGPSAPLLLGRIATPSAPAAGVDALYTKSDGGLYLRNSAGLETPVLAGDVALDLNPSFDLLVGGLPATWSPFWASAGVTYAYDTADKVDGAGSYRMVLPNNTNGHNNGSVFAVVGGDLVEHTVWAKASVAGVPLKLGLMTQASGTPDLFSADPTYVWQNPTVMLTTAWAPYTITYRVPAGATAARFTIRPENTSGAARTVWVDRTTSKRTAVTNAYQDTPTAARATANATTALVNATFVTVALAVEAYDYANAFASSTYTVPRAGLVAVNGRASVVAAAVTQRFILSVFVNGAEAARGIDTTAALANQVLGANVSAVLAVAAGDLVTLRAYWQGANQATEPIAYLECRMVNP